jgi:ADP-ribose pyrophosphatase
LITCEIPAGKLEIGEAPELCALRELREETGYSGELECWGEFASSPGFSNEIIHIYGASNLRWEPLAQDEDEFLHVVRMPCEEAFAKLAAGEWLDAKTTLGLLLLRQKRHSF